MRKHLHCTVLLVAGLFTSSAWSGCQFSWSHYGSNEIRNIVRKNIGSEIPDKFCPYAKDYEVVIVFDSFMGSNGCTGYATAGLRKNKSKKMVIRRSSRTRYDTSCSTYEYSVELAADAAVQAVGDVMTSMDDHITAAKKLN
jgi:hypothetical protein